MSMELAWCCDMAVKESALSIQCPGMNTLTWYTVEILKRLRVRADLPWMSDLVKRC